MRIRVRLPYLWNDSNCMAAERVGRPGAHCRSTGLKPPGQRMSASQAHRVKQEFQKISDHISQKSITVGCTRCIIIIIVGLVFHFTRSMNHRHMNTSLRDPDLHWGKRGKDPDLHWGKRGKRHWLTLRREGKRPRLTLRREGKKTPTYTEERGEKDTDLHRGERGKDTDSHWGQRGERHWLTMRREGKRTLTYGEEKEEKDPDLQGGERLQWPRLTLTGGARKAPIYTERQNGSDLHWEEGSERPLLTLRGGVRKAPTYTERRGQKGPYLHWEEGSERALLTLRGGVRKAPTCTEGKGQKGFDLHWEEGSERPRLAGRRVRGPEMAYSSPTSGSFGTARSPVWGTESPVSLLTHIFKGENCSPTPRYPRGGIAQ